MSDKYNERVRAIAIEMATAQYKRAFYSIQTPLMPVTKFNPEDPLAKRGIRLLAENFTESARIAVAHVANSVREYAVKCAAIPAAPGYTVEQYLRDEGLIPDSAQEGGENEG